MVSPLKWQQHDLWPALNLKGGCGQVCFCLISKLVKMSNRRKKALQNPWYKKKIWLLTVMFWGHACLPGQSMWLWADGHPFPLNRTTIMGDLPYQIRKIPFNTNWFATIILTLPRQWHKVLLSRQKLAKLTKWCMKGSKTLWNSMMGAKEKRRHRNRTH